MRIDHLVLGFFGIISGVAIIAVVSKNPAVIGDVFGGTANLYSVLMGGSSSGVSSLPYTSGQVG